MPSDWQAKRIDSILGFAPSSPQLYFQFLLTLEEGGVGEAHICFHALTDCKEWGHICAKHCANWQVQ